MSFTSFPFSLSHSRQSIKSVIRIWDNFVDFSSRLVTEPEKYLILCYILPAQDTNIHSSFQCKIKFNQPPLSLLFFIIIILPFYYCGLIIIIVIPSTNKYTCWCCRLKNLLCTQAYIETVNERQRESWAFECCWIWIRLRIYALLKLGFKPVRRKFILLTADTQR